MTTSVQVAPHSDSQLTAENLSAETGDVSLTYRRFGAAQTDALPLVMLQHFRGNLDSWDPLLVDGLARDREVILVNNRGVGGSTGAVPENVTEMARDAIAFIDALGLERIDLLGFSLGGSCRSGAGPIAPAAGSTARARRHSTSRRPGSAPLDRRGLFARDPG